jgi:ankyrin repeat protein
MARITKSKALFEAAKKGNIDALRKALAGVSIESTDLHQMTPIMLAAQAGHAEAFQFLVEQGANLHALAIDQTDLLECAAEGGNVEIVQGLLNKGHPVEGHWQPRSQVDKRIGHITPLIMAAINEHAGVVRVLLLAGANTNAKYDGETALKMVEESIKHPLDAKDAEKIHQLRAIAELLRVQNRGP